MSGWNRSVERKEETGRKPGKISPRLAAVVILALIAVVGVVCYFAFGNSSQAARHTESKRAGRIKEVTPAAVPKPKTEQKPGVTNDTRSAKERSKKGANGFPEIVTDADGTRWFNGAVIPTLGPGEGMMNGVRDGFDVRHFKHHAENVIAEFFVRNGGDRCSAILKFDKDFEKSFLDALMDPTPIKEDDTPEIVELKKATLEQVKEIRKRIKNGETLQEIMNAQINLSQKVANMKDTYRDAIRDAEQNGSSPEEIKDLVDAANNLLDEYGGSHLELTPAQAAKLKLARREGRARERAEKKGEAE